ncbi:MAG TPA: chemotaxis protein CheB [Gemmatimonadales bacterium]|nr:chemotaxis protein CheB [Gemmatimonadales bacterium]
MEMIAEVQRIPFTQRVVAIAASAGGLSALSTVLGALPPTLNAAVLVLQHLDPSHPSQLAPILARRTRLPVRQAASRDRLRPGTVFTAPPGVHLLVDQEGILSFSHRPLVNFVRPSADRLFESIAGSFGARAVAVVLTGTGRDGAKGAQVVKQAGGTVLVQDEATSEFFGMPGAAALAGEVDQILPLDQIAPALERLIGVTS